MNRYVLLIVIMLIGCGGEEGGTLTVKDNSAPPSIFLTDIKTYDDIERYNGEEVVIEGIFDHIGGTNGVLKMDSGLVIYIPNFDTYKRGDDWFKYVGKRVRVGGMLSIYLNNLEYFQKPCLIIKSFSQAE